MADISVSREHGLSIDDAKSKTREIVDAVQAEFPALVDTVDWNGEGTSANVKGKAFSGVFAVDDSRVSIDINLKMFAKPFKGKVTDKINQRMAEHFG